MSYRSIAKTIAWVSALSLVAASCAAPPPDPASQEHVDLTPGLYKAVLSSSMGSLKGSDRDKKTTEICVKKSDRASFPYKLARNAYLVHPGCTTKRAPREGNKVSGEISCRADPKLAQGANRFVYEGAVAEQSVTITVRMKLEAAVKEDAMSEAQAAQLKIGMKAMERMRFLIDATRIGDCG